MHLELHGAADGVTGSLHRVHVRDTDILLDCGLYQGRRRESNRLNRDIPSWAASAECAVLSHAHIDHSGRLPMLARGGFRGNIFCTPPTRDLCSVMLRDAAMIQEQDAGYINRRNAREGIDDHVEPLYTVEDAQRAVDQMVSLPLYRSMPIAPGAKLTFHNAGHVLGSALVQLDLEERGRHVRLLFTGDLGRAELPLLRDPDFVDDVDTLLMESTYGDRLHPDVRHIDDKLAEIVKETVARGGRVYIPTFALERAQEVLFALERLHERDALPRIPIYIDSPLAIAITEIYKLHPEGLTGEVRRRILSRDDPFSPPELSYVADVQDSKALQRDHTSSIIIAGAGMCEGGRIVHHLSRALGDERNSVCLVGFMAQHTLGRRLLEGRKKVKVLGLERDVHARIHVIDGLSAHADQQDLLDFARETKRRGNLRTVVLAHGEDAAKQTLGQLIDDLGDLEVVLSTKGKRVEL